MRLPRSFGAMAAKMSADALRHPPAGAGRGEPAVDDQRVAGHEAAGVGGQEQQRARELVRIADASLRRRLAHPAMERVDAEDRPGHLAREPSRRDGVDADPAVRPAAREIAREVDDRAFDVWYAVGKSATPAIPAIEAMLMIDPPLPSAS